MNRKRAAENKLVQRDLHANQRKLNSNQGFERKFKTWRIKFKPNL
jgi:hypothetical protein